MERILVTGGLGFIGSNYVTHAYDKWDSASIVNLDAVSHGAVLENLKDLEGKPRYRFVKGDAANKDLVEKLVGDADVVINFAAETHVDRSIANPGVFLHSNTLATFTILEAALRTKLKRLIHISTDEVYGPATSGTSFEENDRLQPSSPYSASKAAADMFVEAYHTTYGLNTVTLRCTNNFGPRQSPEKFIPKTIISALLDRKAPIYGNGMQVRDWIYVLDFCNAIDVAVEKAPAGAIYNVSSGNELPNLDVAKRILSSLGKPPDLLQFVEDRPGHDSRYSLDSSRIRSELQWKPEHSFHESLTETVNWYVQNQSWWKPLLTEKVLSATPWKEKW